MSHRRWSQEAQEWPAYSPGQWPKEKRKGAGKGGKGDQNKRSNEKPPVVRAYDSDGGTTSLPSSADGATQQDGNIQEFFKEFAAMAKTMNHPLPEKLKNLIPNTDREEIKEQQKKLNKLRNLRNRIESKEKSLKTDEIKWENWLKEIKDSVIKQRKVHEDNQEKLQAELTQLRKEEEELKKGNVDLTEEPEEEEPESVEMMIDTLLGEEKKPQDKKKPKEENEDNSGFDLKTILTMQKNMEEQYQRRLMQERENMNQEFHFMLQQAMEQKMPPGIEVVDLQKEDAKMEASGKAPQILAAQLSVAQAACVPFGVARRTRHTPNTSPYGRKQEVPKDEMEVKPVEDEEKEKMTPAPETGQFWVTSAGVLDDAIGLVEVLTCCSRALSYAFLPYFPQPCYFYGFVLTGLDLEGCT